MIQTLHRGPISFVGSELDGQSEQSASTFRALPPGSYVG
jgi:hypothetical protein